MNQPRKFWLNLFKHPTTYGMAYRNKEDAEKQSADCSLCEAVVEVQEVLPNQPPTTTMNNQWISVKDELPRFTRGCLVSYGDVSVQTATFNFAESRWEVYFGGPECSPTHWQPLPDPPPKPDPFEEWWSTHEQYTQGNPAHEGCRYIEGCITSFYAARAIWTAALASKP